MEVSNEYDEDRELVQVPKKKRRTTSKRKSKAKRRYPELQSEIDTDDELAESVSMGENTWTKDLCRELRKYRFNATALSWQHDVDAQYYNGIHNSYKLWAILISIVSAIFIGGIMARVENADKAVSYVLSGAALILNLIVAIINGILQVNNYGNKIANHSESAGKFGKLERKIGKEFRKSKDLRCSATTLTDYVAERYNELDAEHPFIRGSTVKKWNEEQLETLENDILLLPGEFAESSVSVAVRK